MSLQHKGVMLTLAAFVWWGLAPVYFKQLTGVEAFEILAHRIVWSTLALLLVMWALKRKILIGQMLRNSRLRLLLCGSAVLISVNWLIFAWAVTNDQILATSLGYFINPLLSVLLGMIFLGERLTKNQYLALSLVVLAVGNQIISYGTLPWVALSLAFSFAFYGLIRKQTEIDAYNGLLLEVLLVLPLAIVYLAFKAVNGTLVFAHVSQYLDVNLVLSGVVTTVPLVLFAAGAKHIRLATVGFLQYLAPSLTFLLAVWYYQEPLGMAKLVSFMLIWLALIIISIEAFKENKRAKLATTIKT